MIDNKYFTAQVRRGIFSAEIDRRSVDFRFPSQVQLEAVPSDEFTSASEACLKAISSAEGIIVVLDARAGGSDWGAATAPLVGAIQEAPAALKVVVGSFPDMLAPTAKNEAHVACVSLGLDLGAEGLLACCTDPHEGGASREKEGVPRIWEAMGSVMWSSMVMKPRQTPDTAPPLSDEASAGTGGASESKVAVAEPESDRIAGGGGAASPPPTSTPEAEAAKGIPSEEDDAAAAGRIATALHDTLSAPDVVSTAAGLLAEAGAARHDGDEDAALEAQLGQFEDMLAKVAQVRAATTSRTMTDEQRRALAADMAMALMQALEGGDE